MSKYEIHPLPALHFPITTKDMVNIRLHMAFTLLLIYIIKSTSTGFPQKGLGKGQGSSYLVEVTSKIKEGRVFVKMANTGCITQGSHSARHAFVLRELISLNIFK